MKINDLNESTTSGSVATVAQPMNGVQSRTGVYPNSTKTGNMFKGKKTNKPFANSVKLSEGAIKDVVADLEHLDNGNFQKKYKASKEVIKAKFGLKEAHLEEDDIILTPGQGRSSKTGFIANNSNRSENEGETLKNSLHSIARSAEKLDNYLSSKDQFPEWVSEKIGAINSMMNTVMQYLISRGEMQHDGDLDEADSKHPGLWANIHAKRERIKHGSGEHMRKPGSKGAPTAQAFKDSAKTTNENQSNSKFKVRIICDDGGSTTYTISAASEKEAMRKASRIADSEGYEDFWTKIVPNTSSKNKEIDITADNIDDIFNEGAKVDRMVGHIKKSEEKAGKSKDTAEKIAWATANKRGLLNNKNGKK
jgi:hypothetical protein